MEAALWGSEGERHGEGRFRAVVLHWDRADQLYTQLTFPPCIILLLEHFVTSHVSVHLLGSPSSGLPWSLSCSQVWLSPR